jgi:hypothetical protein
MKTRKRFLLFAGPVLAALMFFSSCAVVAPTTEVLLPVMQSSGMQLLFMAQFSRWGLRTNSYTPYQITNAQLLDPSNLMVELVGNGTYGSYYLRMTVLIGTNKPTRYANYYVYSNGILVTSINLVGLKSIKNIVTLSDYDTAFYSKRCAMKMSGVLYYHNLTNSIFLTNHFTNVVIQDNSTSNLMSGNYFNDFDFNTEGLVWDGTRTNFQSATMMNTSGSINNMAFQLDLIQPNDQFDIAKNNTLTTVGETNCTGFMENLAGSCSYYLIYGANSHQFTFTGLGTATFDGLLLNIQSSASTFQFSMTNSL